MFLYPLIAELKIIQKDGTVARFGDVMNYAQREIIDTVEDMMEQGKPIRIVVLKARQIGVSTVIEAIIFILAMMQQNTRCMIVSHELDSAEHLLSMTSNYWNTFTLKSLFTPRFASQKRLAWKETNSGIQITTAKNVRSGRSRTIQVLHASEVAFWDDPDLLMTGLRQSIPNTPNSFIFVESTANGIGNYFSATWEAAESGDNEFVPLFFPWHKHNEYTASTLGIPFDPLPSLTDPEAIAEENNLRAMGIGNDRLAWRRWAIKNNCQNSVEIFHQEYPTTPEEAFISTGTNVFPLPKLRTVYEPMHGTRGRLTRESSGRVRFQDDVSGDFKIFKYPSDDTSYGIYMVGGDPTRTTHGDPACAQIINRRTWEQVAVLRIKIDPSSFAEELAKVGTYYNQAMLVPEIEGPGYATIGALLQMDYPYIWKNQWADKAPGKVADNYGWQTTQKRKHWAIGNLLRAVVDGDIIIHDSDTFNEMKNYVTMTSGEMGPANADGHDDTVMALAIALTATITEAATIPAYGQMVQENKKSLVEIGNDAIGLTSDPVWSSWDRGDRDQEVYN